jgi:hypothetical protein
MLEARTACVAHSCEPEDGGMTPEISPAQVSEMTGLQAKLEACGFKVRVRETGFLYESAQVEVTLLRPVVFYRVVQRCFASCPESALSLAVERMRTSLSESELLEVQQVNQPDENTATLVLDPTATTRLEEIKTKLEELNTRDPLDFWEEIKKLEQERSELERDAAA